MATRLVLAPVVEQDISEAYDWYEDRRTGLGEDFLLCVDACFESVRRSPEMYPVAHGEHRRCLVRRFPYAVFYEFAEETVTIHGVLHTARDPQKWRQRVA